MTRAWVGLLGCASLVLAGAAVAADQGKGKGPDHQQQQEQGKGGGPDKGGGKGHAKHQHKHANGHALLGDKIKQDGKHNVGKFANRDVTVEVKGGKVHSMAAGDLPMKRVRSKQKMAEADGLFVRAAWTAPAAGLQLAQYDDYYYGYCFDDGVDFNCYWYPASDVDYADYTWDDYDPYY